MVINNQKKKNTIKVMVFIFGVTGFVLLMILDKLYFETSIFLEGWPNTSLSYLIRSFTLFIFVLAVFCSLIGNNRPRLIISNSNGVNLEYLSIFGILSFSVTLLFLFILEPSTFNILSLEDGPIELLSALLLFISCIIIAATYAKSFNNSRNSKLINLSLVFLASLFLLMAMEEVSWFQRVLEIDTPKAFDGNTQKEMNFHNFATNHVENAYYFSTFLFLVVSPFVRLLFPFVSANNYLRVFVARPFVGVIGSIAYAYNFDMWNGIFTQIAFFGSVMILFAFALFSSNMKDKYIISFSIILVVTTQVLFLMNGENFSRIWEVTEYKELLIPLALFVYSIDVFSHINRACLPEQS